jgi:lysophospholipase L1-like esterase
MLRDGLYFHNVTEIQETPGGTLKLYRFPASVRYALSDRGRFIAEEASGCEVRFVTDAQTLRVAIRIPETDGDVYLFCGGLFHSQHRLQAGVLHTLQLETPKRLATVQREPLLASGFVPEVWRICFGRYTAEWGGVQTFGRPVRPPQAHEQPQRRWLAYGSSITHGIYNQPMTYVQQAARHLGLDVYNAGLSGSCLCESEVADFLASRSDWEVAALELGVNMRDRFTPEQFREATGYLLEQLLQRHPEKPIFLITIYPNFATYNQSEITEKDRAFNAILREHVDRLQHPHIHVIEGDQVLDDFSGLSVDLVHPGEYGHMRMALNLAGRMRAVLGEYPGF